MKYNTEELRKKYYSCYSLKMMEELERLGFVEVDSFRNLETLKHCKIYEMTDELSKFLTEWSNKKNKI